MDPHRPYVAILDSKSLALIYLLNLMSLPKIESGELISQQQHS